jgi:hypothetical protein
MNGLDEEYEAPRAEVRGVFLCENIANIQSPVKRVTLVDWTEGQEQAEGEGDVALAWW